MEYVYILSANFTQRRRGVGGRHKPFPLNDETHPSRMSSVLNWRCTKTDKDNGTQLLHWATLSFPRGTLMLGQPSISESLTEMVHTFSLSPKKMNNLQPPESLSGCIYVASSRLNCQSVFKNCKSFQGEFIHLTSKKALFRWIIREAYNYLSWL